MSESPFEDPQALPASDRPEAEARAIALAERALRSLDRARDGVSALKQVLEQLCTLAATFERVSFRLSEVSKGMSPTPPAGPIGERTAALDFVIDIARRTALAIRELEGSMRMSVSASDRLIAQAEDGRRALHELIPAVRELGAAAARANPRTPSIEVVVRPSVRPAPETPEQKIASFLGTIWPLPVGGSGSKN
jgi:hypothetical protein